MTVMTREQVTVDLTDWVSAHGQGAGGHGDEELRELIVSALELEYVSESCRGGIRTGNHYQSVRLGDQRAAGFRGDRDRILDQVDFRGKTVLDLGCNLGELSRGARSRGATRVLGVEYDELFIAIGRAVNAYNGLDGVELRQGDIGDPALYAEHFDIVLVFSVFQYVGPVVEEVCAITDRLLVLETHRLEDNLEAGYVEPVSRHLPSYVSLGSTDWAEQQDAAEERAVLAFAKTPKVLSRALKRSARPKREHRALARLRSRGAEASEPPRAAPGTSVPEVDPDPSVVLLDVKATSRALQERFFSVFDFASADELLGAIRGLSFDVDAMARNADVARGYRGWLYWTAYLKGYTEYEAAGQVRPENTFCRFFAEHHLPGVDEPGMEPGAAQEIAQRRFRDVDEMKAMAGVDRPQALSFPPLRVIASDPPPKRSLRVRLAEGGETVQARQVDGWHRLFGAAIFAIPSLRCHVVREHYGHVPGRVERFEWRDGKLHLHGWAVGNEAAWQFVEVRVDGETIGRSTGVEREDVAAAFDGAQRARRAGFRLSHAIDLSGEGAHSIDLLPMADWLPVGRLRLHFAPAVLEDPNLLAWSQATGVTGPALQNAVVAQTTAVAEALAKLTPQERAVGRVLALDGLQAAVFRALVPGAEIAVAAGDDPWKGASDLDAVVAGDAVAGVPADARADWLAGAGGALKPGGLLVLSGRDSVPAETGPALRVMVRPAPEPVAAGSAAVLTHA